MTVGKTRHWETTNKALLNPPKEQLADAVAATQRRAEALTVRRSMEVQQMLQDASTVTAPLLTMEGKLTEYGDRYVSQYNPEVGVPGGLVPTPCSCSGSTRCAQRFRRRWCRLRAGSMW